MRITRKIVPMVFLALLGLLSTSFAADEVSTADGIVARVGAIPITEYEWQREVNKLFPLQGSFHGGVSKEKLDEIKNNALDELIEQAYMVQYALVEELSASNADVEKIMAPIHEKYPDQEAYKSAFGAEGESRYRGSVYRQLLAKRAEDVAVTQKVNVTDEAVKSFYGENEHRFRRPRQYTASHILVKVDPSSNAEEREKLKERAEELAKRAKSGEDFYNLAYYNSDDRSKFVGGSLGAFHAGQTVKEFDEAIQKMKPGEIVGPVKTMYGYHIIKLDSVDEARQLTFDEMAPKIRQQLEAEQTETLRKEWLDGLKKQYVVEKY